MSKVYIGTSGWVYGDWSFDYAQDKLNYFYPSKLPKRKWLEYYSQNFKTVEINSTFYHAAKPKTFEAWAAVVPDGFIFAVKASRFLSHIKRLNAPRDSIKYQLESVAALGKKLGPLLLQCPPRWKADEKRLGAFLVSIKKIAGPVTSFPPASAHELFYGPQTLDSDTVIKKKNWLRAVGSPSSGATRNFFSGYKLAFEFRDPSWFSEVIYEVLKKHNAALVIAESGGKWPCKEIITADFTYIRFHGEGGSYATKYTDDELKEWAKKIKKWQKSGIDVYAYFNNDVGAFAVENAKKLITMI